jgi:hypothetical protein
MRRLPLPIGSRKGAKHKSHNTRTCIVGCHLWEAAHLSFQRPWTVQGDLEGDLRMKRLSMVLSVTVLAMVMAPAWAANPTAPSTQVKMKSDVSVPSVEVTPTPEMWFYQQYQQQYQDPQSMVHRAADARAAERARRLAAQKWYGISNARPRASTDPYNDDASPHWVSGNDFFPSRWHNQAGVTIIVPHDKQ